jgi:hypothetical protein
MATDEEIVRESNPNASGPQRASGGMGISSEREGPTGPGQHSTDGTRDVRPGAEPEGEDVPEKEPGNPEENPAGLPPKASWPSLDPRSDGKEPRRGDPGLRHAD